MTRRAEREGATVQTAAWQQGATLAAMIPPRVRFAPSPTGYFHVGSARTALFNWLFARQQGGMFILRIEDTDAERNEERHIVGIQAALRWLGLDWDGSPFFQSQRLDLYQAAIEKLLADGLAYACDCRPEDIRGRNVPGYDGFCRDRGLDPSLGRVVRFRTPDEGITVVDDVIRGRPEFANSTLEDFAIRKSRGQPLFILANVVDDADMRISHVIRGEDHLTNTAKYQLLWSALGYGEYPVFAHLPLLVNEKRHKLSKRRDKVALEQYRQEGFLAEAMRNYLALLGWSPGGDREILALGELIAEFRLEAVKRAPAFFDEKKLTAMNADYLRALPTDEFVDRAQNWLGDRWAGIAPLIQERARTLAEVYAMADFLVLPEPAMSAKDWEKAVQQQPAFAAILDRAIAAYTDCPWDAQTLLQVTATIGEEAGVAQLRKVQAPIRLAVTGRSVGPPLWESLEALGRERTLSRLRAARALLAASGPGPARLQGS